MQKNKDLDMQSTNWVHKNTQFIADRFPNCVTETADGRKIDFDLLRQELSTDLIDGHKERYRLEWPGKREAIVTANLPTNKTLRPVREDSVNFDTTENLYIEGDNLEVLKLLQESYLGEIKMIYIDPPYNTGKDFVYKDNFSKEKQQELFDSGQKDEYNQRLVANPDSSGRYHSDWLSMMYPRLKLARNLLKDDGIIIISIDEKESHNLRKVCDEIFGYENFTGEIIWKNSSKNDQAYISIQHEYILCYVKDKNVNNGNWIEKKEGLDEIYRAFDSFKKEHGNNWEAIHRSALAWYNQYPDSHAIKSSKHYNWMDEKGVYFASDISGPNYGQYVYDVTHPITNKVCKPPASGWRFPKDKLIEKINANLIHFGADHKTVPNNKTYLKETEYQSLTSIRYKDGRVASKNLTKLFGEKLFTNPKDSDLLFEMFKSFELKENDIIFDFFSGSSTTAEAVFKLNQSLFSNCKYIMVQVQEDLNETLKISTGGTKATVKRAIRFLNKIEKKPNICEIGKERIRRAGQAILTEQAQKVVDLKTKVKGIEEKIAKLSVGQLPLDNDPKAMALKAEQSNLQTQITQLQKGIDQLDVGFRVYRLDESNMQEVYYRPQDYKQGSLDLFADNVKPDRTADDLLAQIMLDWGLPLSLPIEQASVAGKQVFKVAGNSLYACFDRGIDEAFAKAIAADQPLRMVFRDSGFKDDTAKTNVKQLLKQLSPDTEMKVL